MPRTLSQLDALDVTVLKGVGPERAKALDDAFGIETVLDLLTHYPNRHHDKSRQANINELKEGDQAWLLVTVLSARQVRGRNNRSRFTYRVTDGTGHLTLTWFTPRHMRLREGSEVLIFGKVDVFKGARSMSHPEVDVVGLADARIVPVYPQSPKYRIESREVEGWVQETLDRAGQFAEVVPEAILDRFDFVDRTAAFHGIHRPGSWREIAEAKRRLVFDELLRLQVALVLRKRALERTTRGIAHDTSGELVRRFHERLPFPLTGAQEDVISEIVADLARPHPMHRLLQGDVGSGKTVVAVSALLTAVQGGYQGALMAPTEVLAEQHALGVRDLLDGFTVPDDDPGTMFPERGLRVELLTNRTTASERRRLTDDLAAGRVDILIGTHALIQEGVTFRSLGMVVIDEQHRFGVEQRAALKEKSLSDAAPDVLVMTATPIPRTAAMTVYGDLDVSVLGEMPPGRTPVTTTWVRAASGDRTLDEQAVWAHVRDEVAAGRQAYVVCPLIEESEKLEVRSAEETYERLSEGELSSQRLGLLHGRVSAGEKEKVMSLFRSGALDVLVSTTVIEVGVDVPNATVMVVLDADRFGIAQLHQLRGRVGRGADHSSCYLLGAATTPDAELRLSALVDTTDGFVLAEVDLDLRGEGTIMGERQKGRNDLKLASLRRDREWVQVARDVAFELVDEDPVAPLSRYQGLAAEVALFLGEDEADFLLKS